MDTEPISNDPQGLLERAFIAGSLRSRRYRLKQLSDLARGRVKQLMTEASTLASARLTEVEARARLIGEVHGAAQPMG